MRALSQALRPPEFLCIPSFEGEPKPVKIEGDIDTFTNDLWTNLNEDNKVSLFTRFINLKTGKIETRIVNKNK